MKRVKVNAYQVALVFKDGVYKYMLKEGKYWLWNKEVYVYDVTRPFVAPIELNILLQDADLANALQVVEVKDNEIVLMYENGLLKQVLNAGRYTYWKSAIEYVFVKADMGKVEIDENIDRVVLQNRLLVPYVRSYSVENYEEALLFVDGKFQKRLQSGMYYWWKNNIAVHVGKADKRLQQLEINGQEILTKDKAALRLNAWAQYKVADIEKALLQNKEYDKQLYVAFQLALREYIAAYGFDELLEKKEALAPFVLEAVKEKAAALGVEVIGFGIRDIILPGDVKEIMNQVLIAEKKAQANSIMRREETASTRSLLNTAKLMEENAMLWKLKEMEYVEKIADKISNISVSGNGVLIEQLKQIFVPQK
ncbi:slipin family protein [Lacibacter sediminis]|uniref:Slipin family protein n=1 Tax=Lacibacter sediminis TaxID=2760713 RepID=A0A7G5XHK4_9BACT|nr:slipin family protein [Lacibacter sediminis]QNA44957.1 slipin family protein [Lacibacter sediminis]